MDTRCFGCAERCERSALKLVGDGLFCSSCFTRLIEQVAPLRTPEAEQFAERVAPRPGERSTELVREARERVPEPAVSASRTPAEEIPGTGRCYLCEQHVVGDAFLEVQNLVICEPCSHALFIEPKQDTEPGAQTTEQRSVLTEEEPEVVHTPGSGTVYCFQCQRPMPGPGSFKVLNQKPFCPECAASLPKAAEERTGRSHAVAQDRAPAPRDVARAAAHLPSERRCDCCRRRLVPEHFRITRGFWICEACLSSEPTLALSIAKARYRIALERLGRTLTADATEPG